MRYNGGIYGHKKYNQTGKTNSLLASTYHYADSVYRYLSRAVSSTFSYLDSVTKEGIKIVSVISNFTYSDIVEAVGIISDRLNQFITDTFHFSDTFSISGTLNHFKKLPQVILASARTIGGFVAIVKPQGISQRQKPKGV